jgi:phosphoenolpyruvate carboxykinase (ATP)
MSLRYTRAIIDAIHDGSLDGIECVTDPLFGLAVPKSCPNVPAEILTPKSTWADKARYEETARKLAGLFHKNFEKYADVAGEKIRAAGPQV